MIPASFEYVAPTTVEEALQALAEHGAAGDDVKILAGGQSLLPVLRMRLNAPEVVIDLGGISSLRGIRDDGDAIVIGAMTTHHDVRDDHARKGQGDAIGDARLAVMQPLEPAIAGEERREGKPAQSEDQECQHTPQHGGID